MAGRIAVVDEQNRFLRWEARHVIHERRLVHRSVHVMVFDSRGRLVIQRRHRDKETYPNTWDNSVAGHVEESDYIGGPDDDLDRVYAEVAARELEEELGVSAPLVELGHFPPMPGVHYEQLRLFRTQSDGPFRIQESEVEEIRQVTYEEYQRLVSRRPADSITGAPVTHALRFFGDWVHERGLWG